jgi:PAS domain S-box-containing protein
MIQKIRAFFSAPVFDGDIEKTLKSRQLTRVLNVLLVGTMIYTVLLPVFAGGVPPRFYMILPLYIICILGQVLVHRGRLEQGSLLLILGMWLAVTSAEVTLGGIKSPAFVGNIIVILIAAVLGGSTTAVMITLLTFLKGLLLIVLDKNGLLPVPMQYATSETIILLTQFFASTMVIGLLQISTQNIRLALERAHRELAERRQMGKDLLQSEQKFRELYETVQKLAQELALEAHVRTAMAQALNRDELLRNVVESIARSYGYTLVSLYLIEGDNLILQHQVGYESVISRIAMTEGISGRVARTGKPVLLEDVRSDPEFIGAIKDLVSEICIPLLDEEQVVGTLNVESTNGVKLTEVDLKLLTGLSEHIGIAIGQIRLYSSLRQRNRILAALEQSTLVLMRQLDLNDVLQTIISQAAQIMGTSHGYIYLVQPDEETMQVITGVGIFSESIGKTLKPGEGLAGKIWNSGKPLNVPNYHAWMDRSRKFDDISFHAVVGVPLISVSRVVGVLGLAYLEPGRAFNEDDIDLLSRFGQLASIALENARLYNIVQQELSERKRTEQALSFSEEKFSKAFHTTPVLMTIEDAESRFIDVNRAFIETIGYERSDIIGRRASELQMWVAPEDIKIVRQHLKEQEELKDLESRFRRKSGEIGYVLMSTAKFDVNEVSYSLTAALDITERKHAEAEREKLIAELEAKNAELERFTYTVSHDLKSPLVTIRGFLGYIEEDSLSGNRERLKEDLQRVKDATNKMQRLLGELVELSRVGQLATVSEVIPFAALAREALDAVHGQLEAGQVNVNLQPGLPDVYGDHSRLVEALQNLIDNAAKYIGTQTKPLIEIGCRGEEHGNPIFYIRDNGMGIAAEYHETIFGLFNKLDANSEGTGMGLAIVKRIIEVHGGRIWVESEAGKGSTFYFTLAGNQKNL